MKRFLLLTGIIFTLGSFGYQADADNIIKALQQGNVTQFANSFDNFLDIKLPQKDELKNVGKTQATITVKNFYEENAISGFDLTSQRENEGTMYVVGKLTGGAKPYSLTLLMKARGDKLSIIKIRVN